MMFNRVALALAIVLSGGPAKAQLVSESGDKLLVCPDRPPEPELVSNMGLTESHKAILIQRMYRATSSCLGSNGLIPLSFDHCSHRRQLDLFPDNALGSVNLSSLDRMTSRLSSISSSLWISNQC